MSEQLWDMCREKLCQTNKVIRVGRNNVRTVKGYVQGEIMS